MKSPENSDGQDFSKEQLLNLIGLTMQNCTTAGNNDSEIPELIKIREEVESGVIPQSKYKETGERVRAIFSSKIVR
jgi:hypothetical protein